jgi:hypothetical protein
MTTEDIFTLVLACVGISVAAVLIGRMAHAQRLNAILVAT